MNTMFVVTHLPLSYEMPVAYSSIKVGQNQFDANYIDSVGDNISNLNPNFCELTALYWIWKNYSSLPDSVVGLGHYRRLLVNNSIWSVLFKIPVSMERAEYLLKENDLILPRKVPVFSGIYEHYKESHQIEDLHLMIQALEEIHGLKTESIVDYLKNQKWAYLFNMLICKRSLLDRYCDWVFPVLFEIHKRLDYSNRSKYQARAVGFLAERLFNIWVWINKDFLIKELPVSRLDKSGLSNLNAYRKDFYGCKPL